MNLTKQQVIDILERTLFTAIEAGLAYLIVYLGGVNAWWTVPLATALAGAKTWIATHMGNGTAAMVEPSDVGGTPSPGLPPS
jgi:hypothetical protein